MFWFWFLFDLIDAARRLARALGGRLQVANRTDGVSGVCFRLSLLLELPGQRDARAVAIDRAPSCADDVSLLGYHALVVDDSATNRRVAERLLRGMGCTCTLAEDGDEVPGAVAREAFDVLLLDIRMIRVNGDAACAALRAGGYSGPIIAVTGNATLLDTEDYQRGGFTATLGKPFGAAELRACLVRAVRHRSSSK